MRQEASADGRIHVSFLKRVVAEVPQAVAQFGTAGAKRPPSDAEVTEEFAVRPFLELKRRLYLHGNARERLRDGVVQFDGEARPLDRLEVGLYAGDRFAGEFSSTAFRTPPELKVPESDP